jgi:hypothetical protein
MDTNTESMRTLHSNSLRWKPPGKGLYPIHRPPYPLGPSRITNPVKILPLRMTPRVTRRRTLLMSLQAIKLSHSDWMRTRCEIRCLSVSGCVLIFFAASPISLRNCPVRLPKRPLASQERRRRRTMTSWPRGFDPWSLLISQTQGRNLLRSESVHPFTSFI